MPLQLKTIRWFVLGAGVLFALTACSGKQGVVPTVDNGQISPANKYGQY